MRQGGARRQALVPTVLGLLDGFGPVETLQSTGTMFRECRAGADVVLVGCAHSDASIPHGRPLHGCNTN